MNVAAERRWYAKSPEGSEVPLVISVGVPEKQEDDWSCSVSLGVLDSRSYTIRGIDSWQALQLAMSFVARRVGSFMENGWELYWEKGGDQARPNDLLEWNSPL